MEQGTHEKNPMSHLEHPGPESPASKGTANKASSSSSSKGADPSSSSQKQSSRSNETTSHGGSPAIHRPDAGEESTDPDVKKHNEEMEHRADRSVNQLGKDNEAGQKF